ncbi:MAG: Archaeal/vacuolar-type H+-ATPase subunit H [Anaerolineae bacterium]|jgi:cell division septum initiation protein DivIVA|nr:MAG: Archaeal/vacuolar-type H+-ATPase subunit H [Anaerolineae bacterium]
MDIMHLIDRLEEVLNESRQLPFTHNIIVDEERVFEIIDQMRALIPEEVKKAQQLLAQKDRILAQAQEEANRTLAIAKEKRDQMVEREAIVQAAHARAEQILAEARIEQENTRREADAYVLETLRRLEMELERSLTQVRNGISYLQSERLQTTKEAE